MRGRSEISIAGCKRWWRRHSGQGTVVAEKVLREIEGMEKVVGKRMYRGILKSVARVWNPKEIQDKTIQERVWHTCKRRNEDCGEPRLHEKRRVGTFARVLGSCD